MDTSYIPDIIYNHKNLFYENEKLVVCAIVLDREFKLIAIFYILAYVLAI